MKQLITLVAVLLAAYSQAQMLGTYQFTGAGSCPNQDDSITVQPANAMFSNFSAQNVACNAATDVYNFQSWNTTSGIDLNEYIEFTFSPDPCYRATLDSIIFSHRNSPAGGTPDWHLRSSADNFASDLAMGLSSTTVDTDTILLPSGTFGMVDDVTFRFYLVNMGVTAATWRVDDVQLFGNVSFFGTMDFYLDNDSDGYGTGAIVAMCDNPGGYALVNGDCDDNDQFINPGTIWYADVDGDGYGDPNSTETGCSSTLTNAIYYNNSDCDDNNNLISLAAIAGTYTIDDATPCQNQTFSNTLTGSVGTISWSLSTDGGMSWMPLGSNAAVFTTSVPNPGSPVLVAAIVSYGTCMNDTSNMIAVQVLANQNWYVDLDSDGFGDNATSVVDCQQPNGYVADNTDCDDTDGNVNPNTVWFADVDGDGFGDSGTSETTCVPTLTNATLDNTDCDDSDSNINPNTVWHPDGDSDGFGDVNMSETACVSSYFVPVLDGTDCDDSRDYVYPGAIEVCDEFDNNCNGSTDEGFTLTTYYMDNDADGYGSGSAGDFCSDPGVGYTAVNGDCDDNDQLIFPGATDVAGDAVDQNCDGVDGVLALEEIMMSILPVFPNPGTDNFFISSENLEKGENLLTIIDINGRIIKKSTLNITQVAFMEIETTTFPKGVYQILVSNQKQVLRTNWVKL